MKLPVSSLMRLSEIEIGERRRALDAAKVRALADSILEVGLLNPVSVDKGGVLVAGRHRLAACELLGWADVPVLVLDVDELHAELAEIDENLCRNDLTALEQAESLARRQEIYERLHPEACARSGERQRARALGEPDDKLAPGFAADAAAKTGRSERTIQRDIRTAKALAPDVRDAIRGTGLAGNKSALTALADESEERQRALVAAGPEAVRAAAQEKRVSKLTAKERARLVREAEIGQRMLRGEPEPARETEHQEEPDALLRALKAIDAALKILADESAAPSWRIDDATRVLTAARKAGSR